MGLAALALQAAPSENIRPFVFDGRAYMRVEASTRVMPQEEYQRLLLERDHARLRWENQPAHGIGIGALDAEEIPLLAAAVAHKSVSGELKRRIAQLQQQQLIVMTLPDKPGSRLQQYRLTDQGWAVLKGADE